MEKAKTAPFDYPVFPWGYCADILIFELLSSTKRKERLMTSKSFGTQNPQIPHLSKGEIADLRRDVEAGIDTLEKMLEKGQVACAALLFATNPTATNTVTIGSDVYEFDGAGANINVPIGGSVAITKASFVQAINEEGTENVLAVANSPVAAAVNIFQADEPGGDKVVGPGESMVLAETLADAGDVWNQANLNVLGKSAGVGNVSTGKVVIDAKNLATDFHIELGFTVSDVIWQAYSTTNALKPTTALVTPSGTGLLVNANEGATPLVATDVIKWIAVGAA